MDMNRCFFMKKEDRKPKWHLIDAKGKALGRLATHVSDILRGKDKSNFTPYIDCGDYVVITNCDKVLLTGNKMEDKLYRRHSGWKGGLKERTVSEMFKKDPTFIIRHAVKGMLPRNRLSRQIIKKLKIYVGGEHSHTAQLS